MRPALLALGLLAAPAGAQFRAPAVPSALPRPLHLVIAGPPASGKGTHGRLLAAELGLAHVDTGDLLRRQAEGDPALAETLRKAEFADAALVARLVEGRLALPDAAPGFVLDGAPRRDRDVDALERMEDAQPLHAVLILEAPEGELRERFLKRGRSDGTEANFRKKLDDYNGLTLPALARLGRQVRVIRVDASGSVEAVYARLRAALDDAFGAGSDP